MLYQLQQGQTGRNLLGGDEFWRHVLLSTPGEGSDGGTTASDLSSYARTLTFNGSVTTSTTTADSGSSSLWYPDAASSYINVSSPEDFATGTSELTIEFSIYVVATSVGRQLVMRKKSTDISGFAFVLQILAGTTQLSLTYSTGTSQYGITSTGSVGTGAWVKVALERWNNPVSASDVFSAYLNHKLVSQSTDTGTLSMSAGTGVFEIGSSESFSTTKPNYYLDDIRITKAGRYQGSSTYAQNPGPFPAHD